MLTQSHQACLVRYSGFLSYWNGAEQIAPNGNASEFPYDVQFDSRPRHRLYWSFIDFPQSVQANLGIVS